MKGKVLYVSDLDGTLLRSDQHTSEFTDKVISKMMEEGHLFTYATARSIYTTKEALNGTVVKMPVILYNGALILDGETGEIVESHYLGEGAADLLQDLYEHNVYPIVYAYVNHMERFSYIVEKSTCYLMDFIGTRDDVRRRPVKTESQLSEGDIFYITCIDEAEKLLPLYEKYKEKYHCIYHEDIYSGEHWLEMISPEANKAKAALTLKEKYGCDKLVVFGDDVNDMEMFQVADESYAVYNAVDELKKMATEVIPQNNEDGVALWLKKKTKVTIE